MSTDTPPFRFCVGGVLPELLSKELLVAALAKIERDYPKVYEHFFLQAIEHTVLADNKVFEVPSKESV